MRSPVQRADDSSGTCRGRRERRHHGVDRAARPGAVTQPGACSLFYAQVPAAPVLAIGAAAGVPGISR